jgi:hypothetical protein
VGMCLPSGPYVTEDDVRFIVEATKELILVWLIICQFFKKLYFNGLKNIR